MTAGPPTLADPSRNLRSGFLLEFGRIGPLSGLPPVNRRYSMGIHVDDKENELGKQLREELDTGFITAQNSIPQSG